MKRRLREVDDTAVGGETAPAKCWLCEGVGTVAVHREASAQLGITLWMPFRAGSPAYPTRTCPECRLRSAMLLLDESRQMIKRMGSVLNW